MKVLQRMILGGAILGLVLSPLSVSAELFSFENPLVGKIAADFTLPTLNGGEMSMAEYRGGNSAIIFFWATWCPHCRRALEVLKEKTAELESKNIKLILVDSGESAQQVRAYFEKAGLEMDVFLDERGSLEESYAIIGIPTLVFVSKDGVVRGVKHSLPANYEALLKG